MKGIVKLKVPAVEMTPKLFIITLSKNGVQKRFSKVAFDLGKAIESCHYNTGGCNFKPYSISDYICHTELTIDEINNLFKYFNP